MINVGAVNLTIEGLSVVNPALLVEKTWKIIAMTLSPLLPALGLFQIPCKLMFALARLLLPISKVNVKTRPNINTNK